MTSVNVVAVEFLTTIVIVTVALRRRRLCAPTAGTRTRFRYDTRPAPSCWRHLDLGTWRLEVRAELRRLRCPDHGVVVEAVPFARPGANLTRDLDDLLAWLATRMDKTSIARLCRVSWRTVGRACERVVASELDDHRLDGLFRIGVDEISWRKPQVPDAGGRPRPGKGRLGRQGPRRQDPRRLLRRVRTAAIVPAQRHLHGPRTGLPESVKADGYAPQAIVCADLFHLVVW